MNYFKKVLNFIFPKEKIEKEKVLKILENKILYFPEKKKIIFLPYKNKYIREIIWSMKFKNNFSAAKFFGEIIYENLPDILQELKMKENFHNPVLITIPITFSKKLSRKYNQNDIVVNHFLKLGGSNFTKWEKNILIKTKNTKPQSRIKNKEKRFENIKNSFGIKNPEIIKGKNILLFDDVLTSGATLKEAKKVLKKAGAKKIIFMVLAH